MATFFRLQKCASCVERCDWECEHAGQCELVCGAPCNRLPCNEVGSPAAEIPFVAVDLMFVLLLYRDVPKGLNAGTNAHQFVVRSVQTNDSARNVAIHRFGRELLT